MRPVSDSITYQPGRLRLYAVYIAALPCLIYGSIATVNFHGFFRYAVLTVAVVVTTWAVRRAFRIRLTVSLEGVAIRNYWRSFDLPWAEIKAVRVGTLTMGVMPRPAFRFTLANGKTIPAQATPFDPAAQKAILESARRTAPVGIAWHPPDA